MRQKRITGLDSWCPDASFDTIIKIFIFLDIFDVICVIWHKMSFMSNVAYDKIWHKYSKSIQVSERVSEPQESSMGINFGLKNYLKWNHFNNPLKIFPKSFIFLDEIVMKRGNITKQFFLCFLTSHTSYNGRTFETKLLT